MSDAEDWPPARLADDAAWEAAKRRLFETGEALRETVAKFPVDRLSAKRPRHRWKLERQLLIGELQTRALPRRAGGAAQEGERSRRGVSG